METALMSIGWWMDNGDLHNGMLISSEIMKFAGKRMEPETVVLSKVT